MDDYNQALAIKTDDPFAYECRGVAKAAQQDYQGAIADYDKAIELKPDYAGAFGSRAEAKKALGDDAGATADFAKANHLTPVVVPKEETPHHTEVELNASTDTDTDTTATPSGPSIEFRIFRMVFAACGMAVIFWCFMIYNRFRGIHRE